MSNKEATARIKINKLLETAGWRFFAEGSAPANNRELIARFEKKIQATLSRVGGEGFQLSGICVKETLGPLEEYTHE